VLRVAAYFKKTRKMHLVGLSMGGRIARNVALHHPEWLLSLTLADTSPGFDALSSEQIRTFLSDRKNRTPESMRRLLGTDPAPGAYEELVRSFHALRQESYFKTVDASVAQDRAAPLERIRVPTLVMVGTQDTVYPPQMARDIARRIPGAKLVEIEGAGHLSNLDRPDEFNAALRSFLEGH
jgi:3-oxoadipate enol-lactonase